MRQGQSDIGHNIEINQIQTKRNDSHLEDFVLEKSIFNNIFEKDIRRVFIYKKSERLAKAIHLIAPAFDESVSLRNRVHSIAIALVDAAILPPLSARIELSRELLALSSLLSIARTSGLLSPMNADVISREAHALLQEIAAYEQPRLFLDDVPTLSDIAKSMLSRSTSQNQKLPTTKRATLSEPAQNYKGHIKDNKILSDIPIKDRQESILSVIKNKGKASIKDISTVIRGISEKTIQRELGVLIGAGMVSKQGERRWSTYSLA